MEIQSAAPAPPPQAPDGGRPMGFMDLAFRHQPRLSPEAFRARGAGGLFGADGAGFDDLVDVVNPLQHIPIVSTFYRAMTGDRIAPAPRLMGGALFGGAIGFAIAAVNAVVENLSGRDMGEHVRVALLGDPGTAPGMPEGPPVMVAGGADSTPEQAPPPRQVAERSAPGPWYLAGPSARRAAAAAPEPAPAEPAPALAAAESSTPGSALPEPTAPESTAPESTAPESTPLGPGAAPEATGLADVVPRLTPAQIELLLASVGIAGEGDGPSPPQGRTGPQGRAGQQGGASLGGDAPAGLPGPAVEPGAPPGGRISERMLRALDTYQGSPALHGPAGRRVNVVR